VKGAKAKKPKKMPTEFKKGKWNPDVELIEVDHYLEAPESEPNFECCIRCNNRNMIRAAFTGNIKLAKACIEAKKKLSQLTAWWSPEIKQTAIEHMVLKNDNDMLELVMHPKLTVPKHSNYDAERNAYFSSRIGNPPYLLSFIDSGMVSQMAYGVKVRKV
jgi:hypothetical protein